MSLPHGVDPRTTPPEWYRLPKPPIPQGWLVYSDSRLREALGLAASGGAVAAVTLWLAKTAVASYQFLVMLLARLPLAGWFLTPLVQHSGRSPLGFLSRSAWWKARLRHLGQDALIDDGVMIWGADRMSIGACAYIGLDVKLSAGGAGEANQGTIAIGDYSFIGPSSLIMGSGDVRLGDFVALSSSVRIYSATNLPSDIAQPGVLMSMAHAAPADRQAVQRGAITIGDYAVIGVGSLLFPGVHIGEGALVHPYAEVRNSFAPFANVTGHGRARLNGFRLPLRRDPRLGGPA